MAAFKPSSVSKVTLHWTKVLMSLTFDKLCYLS